MEKIVNISRPKTVKQQMAEKLSTLELNDEFIIDRNDARKWSYNISSFIHPVSDKRYSVIVHRDQVDKDKAIIKRIA